MLVLFLMMIKKCTDMDHLKLRALSVLMIKTTDKCTLSYCWLRNLGTVW